MNRFAHLASALVGLLLGLLGSRATFPQRSAPSLASPPGTGASGGVAAQAGRTSVGDPASDRITRIFSALKEPVELARRYALREALRDLPTAEFPGLLESASRVPSELQQPFTVALMNAWFQVDPAAAGEWMRAHPVQTDGVEAWARSNPVGAIQIALASPELPRSKRLLFAAIEKRAGQDPSAQVAELHGLPPGGLRDQVFADVLNRWADTDPRAAFAAADGMKPGGTRDDARKQVILTWAGKDPESALAQVPALLPTLKPQLIGNPFLMSLAEKVMSKNPQVGLRWIDQLPPEHRQSVAIAGLTTWAAKEPIAALEWGLSHDIQVARGRRTGISSWRNGVLASAIKEAPAAAFTVIESLPPGPRRTGLLERALAELGWLPAAEGNDAIQAALLRRGLPQLSHEAQIAAVQRMVFTNTAISTPADVTAWSQMFPAGELRDFAVGNAVSSLFHTDPKRGERLLADLPPSSARDAALESVVIQSRGRDFAGAAKRALEIGNAQKRQQLFDYVMEAWRERDPAAAEAWQRERR